MSSQYYWALLWRQNNLLDGYTTHLIHDYRDLDRTGPKLFKTRREARDFKRRRYGFIAERADLRAEPHGWMMPKVVKVFVQYTVVGDESGSA